MYHATTTDLPLREPLPHKVAYCLLGAYLPLLGVLLEFQPSRAPRSYRAFEEMLLLPFLVLALGALIGALLLHVFKRRVKLRGATYRGHIESTLGEGAPLEVIWGRLHAVPFVVRLEDGRAALVEPVALALETNEQDQEIVVGAQIEIIGAPRWTADAPRAAYRESTVMCFAGKPESPVGIRLL